MSVESKSLLNRLKIEDNFLSDVPSSWMSNVSFLHTKKSVSMVGAVIDIPEKPIKLLLDFRGLISVELRRNKDNFCYVLTQIQEARPQKQTLKRKDSQPQ